MSNEFNRLFERVSGWMEYQNFQDANEGYITKEKVGEFGMAFFLWRVDKEPVHLDHMFMDGNVYVRFSENYQINL